MVMKDTPCAVQLIRIGKEGEKMATTFSGPREHFSKTCAGRYYTAWGIFTAMEQNSFSTFYSRWTHQAECIYTLVTITSNINIQANVRLIILNISSYSPVHQTSQNSI
jgi:hypothetical protein